MHVYKPLPRGSSGGEGLPESKVAAALALQRVAPA